ncbi:hypothetical protein [Photobacterium swingsii]
MNFNPSTIARSERRGNDEHRYYHEFVRWRDSKRVRREALESQWY